MDLDNPMTFFTYSVTGANGTGLHERSKRIDPHELALVITETLPEILRCYLWQK